MPSPSQWLLDSRLHPAIGDPGGHQQALHRLMPLHIDIELHHMGQGITPAGVVKHHGQVFSPAGQAAIQVHGLTGCCALAQHRGTELGAGAIVDDQSPRSLADAFKHIGRLIESTVPPHPTGQFRGNQWIHHAQSALRAAMPRMTTTSPQTEEAVLGQWAVSSDESFEMLLVIEAGSQGDQPPGLMQADGRIHMLTA